MFPPSAKINLAGMVAGTTSNQPKTGCFEARPYSKPAKSAENNFATEPILIFVPG